MHPIGSDHNETDPMVTGVHIGSDHTETDPMVYV